MRRRPRRNRENPTNWIAGAARRARGRAARSSGCRACGRRARGSPRPSCARRTPAGDRPVRQPVRGEAGDPELGRAQLLRGAPHGHAPQLRFRAVDPRAGADAARRSPPPPRAPRALSLSLQAPEHLSVGEQRPRPLERHRAPLVLVERPDERLRPPAPARLRPRAGARGSAPRPRGSRECATRSVLARTARAAPSARSTSPAATAASIASPSTRQIAGSRKSTRSNSTSAAARWPVGRLGVAGGELGQAEARGARSRRRSAPRSAPRRSLAHRVDPSGERVDVRPPDVVRLGATPCCANASPIRSASSAASASSRPSLEDHPVEQDVGERRVVALLTRLSLGLREPERAPRRSRRRSAATGRA